MERYCITKKQCKQLLDNEIFKKNNSEDDQDFNAIVERSKVYFDSEIVVFNYFISKLLEQFLKRDSSKCEEIINFLNVLNQNMFLTFEEFDHEFIDKLMTMSMPSNLNSLEEDLLEVRNSYYD